MTPDDLSNRVTFSTYLLKLDDVTWGSRQQKQDQVLETIYWIPKIYPLI